MLFIRCVGFITLQKLFGLLIFIVMVKEPLASKFDIAVQNEESCCHITYTMRGQLLSFIVIDQR